ncbi:MAG: cytochrome c oxidase assembly protein, partial [Chloroflexi bacterium]|nr:cytochrome c oxidase assembly protein [Chloroflexota bacterium]
MIPLALEPTALAGSIFLLGAYFVALRGPRARRAPPVGWGQRSAFISGVILIFGALSSPLDVLADQYLFSAHMVQHMMLTMLAAPLLLMGTPGWLLQPLARSGTVVRIARSALFPVVAFSLLNAVFSVSHVPWIYELALAAKPVHIALHAAYLSTALLFWWPLLSPVGDLPRLPYPLQIVYLFLHTVPTAIVGALIGLSDRILYPSYAAAPRLWSITPLADQQIAGLIMWVGGLTIDLVILTAVFFSWAAAAERGVGGQG